MSELVTSRLTKNIAVITVDNPPVNALSPGVPDGILIHLEAALPDERVKGIVLIGAGNTFIAGADIKELQKLARGQSSTLENIQRLLSKLETSSKPVVCAIHGTALGGGLEIAMACHYRVASPSARVGQPEVKLGLIPGAGGTQRLPRLAGLVLAADLCATGRQISAAEAKEAGIIDRIISGDLLDGAIAFATDQAHSGQEPRRTRDLTAQLGDAPANRQALDQLRQRVTKQARGAAAPLKAIEAVEGSATLPFDLGCEKEAELFKACLLSNEASSLMHVFFGERVVSKIPDLPRETSTYTIRQVAVIGAGTMGGGIAMTYLDAGFPVVVKEADQARLDLGLNVIRGNYQAAVKKNRLTQAEMEQRLAKLEPTLDYQKIRQAHIVVEAVFENMALKKQVFREIDAVAAPGAILATNTSTLNIDEIASATGRPASVIGTHFFSPANLMRLLEIVRGKQTSKEVIATCMSLAKRLNKVGVLVGNCHGFVGNRMFGPFIRESQYLAEEGASVVEIDRALVDFGMAMGIFTVEDLAGIDVGWRIRKESPDWLPAGYRKYRAADRLAEAGRYGQKTNAGWYRYEANSRTPIPDPVVETIIAECAAEAGITRRRIEPREIIERMMYALVNEGARILEEGIALRSVDIDIIYINGYGFPAHRGGPMHYADTVGLREVYGRICQFEKEHGFWWKPAPLLKTLAESGKTFADFDRKQG
jgi:3-hydroxyacyl-CoA dehydrogenase